jgi:hypothetical protein
MLLPVEGGDSIAATTLFHLLLILLAGVPVFNTCEGRYALQGARKMYMGGTLA